MVDHVMLFAKRTSQRAPLAPQPAVGVRPVGAYLISVLKIIMDSNVHNWNNAFRSQGQATGFQGLESRTGGRDDYGRIGKACRDDGSFPPGSSGDVELSAKQGL